MPSSVAINRMKSRFAIVMALVVFLLCSIPASSSDTKIISTGDRGSPLSLYDARQTEVRYPNLSSAEELETSGQDETLIKPNRPEDIDPSASPGEVHPKVTNDKGAPKPPLAEVEERTIDETSAPEGGQSSDALEERNQTNPSTPLPDTQSSGDPKLLQVRIVVPAEQAEVLKKLLSAATLYLEEQSAKGASVSSFADAAIKTFGILTAILALVSVVIGYRKNLNLKQHLFLAGPFFVVGVALFFISDLVSVFIITIVLLLFLLVAIVVAATYLFQVLTSQIPFFKEEVASWFYNAPELTSIEKLKVSLELLRFFQEDAGRFEEVIEGEWGHGHSKARFRLQARKGDCAAWVINGNRCSPHLIEVQFAKDDDKYSPEVLEQIELNCAVVRVGSKHKLWPLNARRVFDQVLKHLKKAKNPAVQKLAQKINW